MAMPEFHVDNPALLIRLRIREKRLYEARFLFRQFEGGIEASERGLLAQELAGQLSQVEKLLCLAREALASGEKDRAAELYRAIEAFAIDVPGLVEEKKGLEGVEAVVARITGKTTGQNTGAALSGKAMAAPPPEPAGRQPESPSPGREKPHRPTLGQRLQRWPRMWLAAACLGLLLILLLLLRDYREERSANLTPPAASPAPTQKILIRPLVSPVAPANEQPEREEEPNELASEAPIEPPGETPASSPTLRLGTLQVEEADHK